MNYSWGYHTYTKDVAVRCVRPGHPPPAAAAAVAAAGAAVVAPAGAPPPKWPPWRWATG